jgi:hypothetical protein
MKKMFVLWLATVLTGSVNAEVELLPPDAVLFGKTRGEYLAEYVQYAVPLSTNGDYLLPNAGALGDDPVYFLQRPLFGAPLPGVQTYFVPDDVYVCFPIVFFWGDNVDVFPPLTPDELRNGLKGFVDTITNVHATIDGVALTNLADTRTESPIFATFFPSSDNFYTQILGHPFEGWNDPMVACGYFLMLQPLLAGVHDFRVGAGVGGGGFTFERHFQVQSVPLSAMLSHQTEQLALNVKNSGLKANRQQPLLASLNAAKAALDAQNFRTALNQLQAFQHKVRAQVAPGDQSFAEQLTEAAQRIISKATAQLNTPANN